MPPGISLNNNQEFKLSCSKTQNAKRAFQNAVSKRNPKRSPKRYIFSWEIVVQNVEMERLKRTFWKIGLFGPKHTKRYKKWSVFKRTFPKRAFCVSKRTFRVSKRTFWAGKLVTYLCLLVNYLYRVVSPVSALSR